MLFSSHIKRTGIRKLQLLVAEKLYGLLNADRQTILAQKKGLQTVQAFFTSLGELRNLGFMFLLFYCFRTR